MLDNVVKETAIKKKARSSLRYHKGYSRLLYVLYLLYEISPYLFSSGLINIFFKYCIAGEGRDGAD